jgi:hypothetical protein
MTGYKYNTEEEALISQSICDLYYGIPKNESEFNVTQHWTNYYFANLNEPPFWYIIFDESLIPVLGQPEEFELILPEQNV